MICKKCKSTKSKKWKCACGESNCKHVYKCECGRKKRGRPFGFFAKKHEEEEVSTAPAAMISTPKPEREKPIKISKVADEYITGRGGEKCMYFGDTIGENSVTAVCKQKEMDEVAKLICKKERYEIAKLKELVDNECAIRIDLF